MILRNVVYQSRHSMVSRPANDDIDYNTPLPLLRSGVRLLKLTWS